MHFKRIINAGSGSQNVVSNVLPITQGIQPQVMPTCTFSFTMFSHPTVSRLQEAGAAARQ